MKEEIVATANDNKVEAANRLYARYVEPLELDHAGEYAAVSPDGKVILGPTLLDVLERAATALGPDNIVFKVGERVVGKWLHLGRR
jgi:non-canonical (house-cleaning) NTP pyrophosphatase